MSCPVYIRSRETAKVNFSRCYFTVLMYISTGASGRFLHISQSVPGRSVLKFIPINPRAQGLSNAFRVIIIGLLLFEISARKRWLSNVFGGNAIESCFKRFLVANKNLLQGPYSCLKQSVSVVICPQDLVKTYKHAFEIVGCLPDVQTDFRPVAAALVAVRLRPCARGACSRVGPGPPAGLHPDGQRVVEGRRARGAPPGGWPPEGPLPPTGSRGHREWRGRGACRGAPREGRPGMYFVRDRVRGLWLSWLLKAITLITYIVFQAQQHRAGRPAAAADRLGDEGPPSRPPRRAAAPGQGGPSCDGECSSSCSWPDPWLFHRWGRLSVPSLWCFPGISQRMSGGNVRKFGMLMYPDHTQDWKGQQTIKPFIPFVLPLFISPGPSTSAGSLGSPGSPSAPWRWWGPPGRAAAPGPVGLRPDGECSSSCSWPDPRLIHRRGRLPMLLLWRFPGISRRMSGGSVLKFGMLMYPNHIQDWKGQQTIIPFIPFVLPLFISPGPSTSAGSLGSPSGPWRWWGPPGGAAAPGRAGPRPDGECSSSCSWPDPRLIHRRGQLSVPLLWRFPGISRRMSGGSVLKFGMLM